MVNLGDLVYNIIANDKASATTANVAKSVGGSAVAVGAGITAVSGAVVTLLDGAKKGAAANATMALSFDAPASAVKEMARSLQSVHTPIADAQGAMDLLARAGVKLSDVKTVAPAFDTLGEATGKSATEITEAMIPAFNALNLPLEKAPGQIDGLATMFRKSNVDVSDFSTLMTRVGPDLGSMGLGLTDVEAILMSFADRGITGRKATSELSSAIKAADGDTGALYKSLGITADQLAGYKSKVEGTTGAAQKFADAQNIQYGTTDKIGYQFTLLKQKAADVLKPFEGIATAGLALGPALAGLGGIIASVAGAGGLGAITAAASTAVIPIAAVAGVVALVAGAFYGMYTQSEPFRKMIGSIIEGAESLGKAFIQWVTPIKDAIISALLPALKQMGDFFATQFKKITDWMGGDGKSFIAMLGQVASILQGAIIEGIKLFGKCWSETIEPAFEGAISTAIDGVLGALKNLGDWFASPGTQSGIKTVSDAIESFAVIITKDVIPAVLWMYTQIYKVVTDIVGIFTGKAGAGTDLVATVKESWDKILKYVPIAWDLIKNAVITAAGLIWNWLSTEGVRLAGVAAGAIWSGICTAVPIAWDLVKTAVITAAKLIWDWLTNTAPGLAVTAAGFIWTGIKDAVSLAWGLVKDAVVIAAQFIWDWLTNTAPGLAVTAAGFIWTGIKDAVSLAWDGVKTAVTTAAQLIWDWLTLTAPGLAVTAAGFIWTGIKDAVPNAWVNICNSVYTEAHKIVDKIDEVKNDAKAAAQRVWDGIQAVFDLPHTVATNIVSGVANAVGLGGQTPAGTPSTTVPGQYPVSTGDTMYDPALGQYVPTGIVSHHTGGIYEAPGGNREGLALLLSGERVLSPAQTNDYDSGLLSAVRELTSLIRAGGLGGGGQAITVNIESDIPQVVRRIDQFNANANRQQGYRSGI